MPFEFHKTEIPGVILIAPRVFGDERGFFLETYSKKQFEAGGIHGEFVQDNHSRSVKGVLRGLHFQKGEHAQAKLVRCIRGEVLDVIVDLRKDSPTFGKYMMVPLSEKNKHMLYVPRGFAHGHLTVSDEAEFMYKVDNDYAPHTEGGLVWNDPEVGIPWPIENPTLLEKDMKWPTLDEIKKSQ